MAGNIQGAFAVAFPDGPSASPVEPNKADVRRIGDVIQTEVSEAKNLATLSIQWKQPARAASTADVSISTLGPGSVIDGVTLVTGDRVLLRAQTFQSSQGLYVINASAPATRALDADTGAELIGMAVYVRQGTVNGGKQFVCTAVTPVTIGSTVLPFVEISDQAALEALIAESNNPDLSIVDQFGAEGMRLDGSGAHYGSLRISEAGYPEDGQSVQDPAGYEAFNITEGGVRIGSGQFKESGWDGVEFQDKSGVAGFRIGDGGPELDAATLGRTVAFEPATIGLPNKQVVSRSGRIEVNKYVREKWADPFVSGKPSISQNTADTALNYRNYQLVPSITRVKNRFWAMWYGMYNANLSISPVGEGPGDICIAAYSDDLCQTWTEAFYVVPPNMATDRMIDPIVAEINGKVFLGYSVSGGGYVADGFAGFFGSWLQNPLARKGQFVFSKQEFLGYGFASQSLFDFNDSKCLALSYVPGLAKSSINEEKGRWIGRIDTKTLSYEKFLQSPFEADPAQWSYDERQLIQLRNGNLLCQWRSNVSGGTYRAKYDVEAETWSTPALWSEMAAPVSRQWMARSPTGRVAQIGRAHV